MNKLPLIVIAISFILAAAVYPMLPDEIASHWNASGDADGYTGKFWGLFIFPLLLIGFYLLFIFIPKIDPKNNIQKFRKGYDGFILLFCVYFLYVQILTLLWNFGYRFDMLKALLPSIGVLFLYIGYILPTTKRNYFIGIRTPWTLENDRVWEATHKLGGKVFTYLGILCFALIFVRYYQIWVFLGAILISVVYLLVFSYQEYKRVKKETRHIKPKRKIKN